MSRKHIKTKSSPANASRSKRRVRRRSLAWLWVSLGAILVAVVGILLLSNRTDPSTEITPAQAYAKFQQGAYFLDVRSQEEWDQYHIAGSILIPLGELANRLTEIPKDQDIVMICRSGLRSQSGGSILIKAGYQRVSCLSGGLNAWTAAGYPVEGQAP